MAGSLNKIMLIGNVGRDPEIRHTQDGRPIANLSIATSESWRDKSSGERKERTQWHKVVIFNEGLCKVVEQYVKKGTKLYIEGSSETRKWTDQQGVERYTTEVVLRPYRGEISLLGGGQRSQSEDDYGTTSQSDFGSGNGGGGNGGGRSRSQDLDDEIPFNAGSDGETDLEQWLSVPSLPDYEASSEGRVRRIPYLAQMPNGGERSYGGEAHVGQWDGERFIMTYRGRTYKVARLICEAFNGPPPSSKSICMHANENSRDNRPENLEWATQKDNLNCPGFISYCRARTGDANPYRKGRARKASAA